MAPELGQGAAVFLLASCVDLRSPPHESSSKLGAQAHNLVEGGYDVFVLMNNNGCEGGALSEEALAQPNTSTWGFPSRVRWLVASAFSSRTIAYTVQLTPPLTTCTWCFATWHTLLPAVLLSDDIDWAKYQYIWVFEADVGFYGDWAETLQRYDQFKTDLLTTSDPTVSACDGDNAGREDVFGKSIAGSCGNPEAIGDPDGWAMGRAGNLRLQGYPIWWATLFASRFSARLISAARSAYRKSLWAYAELFWPSVCMHAFGEDGCSRSTLGTPDDLWSCCASCKVLERLRWQLVMPMARGRPPAPSLSGRFLHPVKWDALANTSVPLVDESNHEDCETESFAETVDTRAGQWAVVLGVAVIFGVVAVGTALICLRPIPKPPASARQLEPGERTPLAGAGSNR